MLWQSLRRVRLRRICSLAAGALHSLLRRLHLTLLCWQVKKLKLKRGKPNMANSRNTIIPTRMIFLMMILEAQRDVIYQ